MGLRTMSHHVDDLIAAENYASRFLSCSVTRLIYFLERLVTARAESAARGRPANRCSQRHASIFLDTPPPCGSPSRMPCSARQTPGGSVYHALNRATSRFKRFRQAAGYGTFLQVLDETAEQPSSASWATASGPRTV